MHITKAALPTVVVQIRCSFSCSCTARLEQDRDSQTDIGGIVLLALEEKQEQHFHMFLQRSAFAEAAVGAQRLRPPTALAVAGRGKQTSLRRGRR